MLGVGASTLLVLVVGLVVSRKVAGDSTNFLVAGRALTLPLVAASLMGQAVDANATLGNTDLASTFGFWAGASLPIGLALCLVLTGRFLAAPMNRMGLLTLPDFFKLRYGRGVELAASLILIVSFCILLAGNLVVGGLLFDQFLSTGYAVGVLIVVALVLLYTITGGMFSNAYGAVVQMAITFVAAVALLVWAAVTFGLSAPEGFGAFDLGQLSRREQGAAVNWATLIALGIGDIVAIDFMQRIFSAKDGRTAQRACYWGAAGTLAVGIPFTLVALTAAVVLRDVPVDGPILFIFLTDYAPSGLAVLVLCGIVAASLSTANGVILGTAAVAMRNVRGMNTPLDIDGPDPLLRATRLAMLPVVGLGVLFALRVPETGILLTLAFDLLLAGLAAPFLLGLFWARATTGAAVACIAVGSTVRLVLFALTPTAYGVENTLLYIPNSLVSSGFDGFPTFIAAGAGLLAFFVTALLRPAPATDVPTAVVPAADGARMVLK
jgi:SSS family solute:Na+ symporter